MKPITVTATIKGRSFAATLTGSAYSGRVSICKDGKRITTLDWTDEGFVATGHDLGMADTDDTIDVYDALRRKLLDAIETAGAVS